LDAPVVARTRSTNVFSSPALAAMDFQPWVVSVGLPP
jgi:hypothetical protein